MKAYVRWAVGLALADDDGDHDSVSSRPATGSPFHVAEIANSETPTMVLAQLVAHAFNRRRGRRLYALAAIATVEALCKAAGIEHADLVGYGTIDRDALAAAVMKLLELPTAELRDAARRAWKTGFGAELVAPTLR